MKATLSEVVPQDAEGHLWDVIVVGAGAGGSTAGYNLARLGRSVLFVERGKLIHLDPNVEEGVPYTWTGDPEAALNNGWWPRPFYSRDNDDGAITATRPPIGCGAGGSTAQFNGTMDRFRPGDFTPRRFFPGISDSSVPEAWPVSYEEMETYYQRAETLYRVRGTQDSLAPPGGESVLAPPPPSGRENAVLEALTSVGLHPYRMHSALERTPGCADCAGMLCPNACRNDAARICLYPALEHYGARILPNCRAIRFEESGRAVQRVICDWNGRQISLRARIFILSANAFLTPALLQRSANERFPEGLGNSSGLVGRNLMLHASNHFFVRLRDAPPSLGFSMNHGLSLNDFYNHDGTRLGNLHAHPVAARSELIRFLLQDYGLSSGASPGSPRQPKRRAPPRALLSAITSTGRYLCRSWTVFVGIVEDLPYTENMVEAKAGTEEDIVYRYRYPDELRRRSLTMSESFKNATASRFDVVPLRPLGALNGSHVCGTCRFGDDPRTSVLDRDNRAHDLDNLYVLDASFFPSSGGINPSLTIVANALRATDKIAQRL